MYPENIKFTKSHEYAIIEGDVVTTGLSDFATEHLSDLVYIELPDVGTNVIAGEVFGEVESVKAVAEIKAAVSGEIIESNQEIADDLETLSKDTYGAGWLIKIKMSDSSEADALMSPEEYDKFRASEEVG